MPCLSCQIANEDVAAEGGDIFRSEFFNVSQDYHYNIPGFMIVASNRHFKGLDEMTQNESQEFIEVVHRIRAAQRELGIEDVYYFYNEDTRHHFHLWMIPRLDWMAQWGRSLESLAPSLEWARVHLKDIEPVRAMANAIRARL